MTDLYKCGFILTIPFHVLLQLGEKLPWWRSGNASSSNAGGVRDTGLIRGLEDDPGEGNVNPLLYFCLENPMDRGAWWATAHGGQRVRPN